MKKAYYRAIIAGAIMLAMAPVLLAAVTGQINYQARLLDSYGRPLNSTVNLAFKLYDAAVAGNLLWSETHQGVVVTDGLYAVAMGSKTPISAEVFTQDDVYLELAINNETMAPRQLVTSAGQALVARTVMGPDIFVNQANGKVGIGTTTPAEKLDVAGTIKATGFKMPTGATAGYVLTSDGSGAAGWHPSTATVTNETDPVFAAWVISKFIPVTNDLWTAIAGKVDKSTYNTATNALWAAVNSKASLNGGVMTGPLTNTYGFYGDGSGLTNIGGATLTNYVAKTGDTMTGPLVISNDVTIGAKIVFPSATQTLALGAQIDAASLTYVRIMGSAPGKTTLGTPQIINGTDGQLVIIQGNNSANTVILTNGSGVVLSTRVPFTMGSNDMIQLVYNGGSWVEVHRADN